MRSYPLTLLPSSDPSTRSPLVRDDPRTWRDGRSGGADVERDAGFQERGKSIRVHAEASGPVPGVCLVEREAGELSRPAHARGVRRHRASAGNRPA